MKSKLILSIGAVLLLIGCTTATTTDTSGNKVVVHQLDPQGIEAVNNAVLNALVSPAISNTLFEATRLKP